MAGLASTFADLRSPHHPWRGECRRTIEKLIADLAHDPVYLARGEALEAESLRNRLVRDQITRLCQDLQVAPSSGAETRPASLATGLEVALYQAP